MAFPDRLLKGYSCTQRMRPDYIIRTDPRKWAEADTVSGASPMGVTLEADVLRGAVEPNAFRGSAGDGRLKLYVVTAE
jgi:hypothetical protein